MGCNTNAAVEVSSTVELQIPPFLGMKVECMGRENVAGYVSTRLQLATGTVSGNRLEGALMTVCISSVPSNHSRIFGTSNRAAFSPAQTRSEHLLKPS